MCWRAGKKEEKEERRAIKASKTEAVVIVTNRPCAREVFSLSSWNGGEKEKYPKKGKGVRDQSN